MLPDPANLPQHPPFRLIERARLSPAGDGIVAWVCPASGSAHAGEDGWGAAYLLEMMAQAAAMAPGEAADADGRLRQGVLVQARNLRLYCAGVAPGVCLRVDVTTTGRGSSGYTTFAGRVVVDSSNTLLAEGSFSVLAGGGA